MASRQGIYAVGTARRALHGLVSFNPEKTMQRIVRNWKRYAAVNFQIVWQRDFFDHRIRSKESLDEKWQYIVYRKF